jgi:hypothetical protein
MMMELRGTIGNLQYLHLFEIDIITLFRHLTVALRRVGQRFVPSDCALFLLPLPCAVFPRA